MFTRRITQATAALVLLGAFTGCANFGTTTSGNPKIDIEATHGTIYEGEIVTVTTRSLNTLGTDAKIDWSSTGGKIDSEKNDRVIRVKFDKPGTFIITAKLMLDGHVVDTDQVEVAVKQLVAYEPG